MPTTWASTAAGSLRRTPITVRAVFRCVASRNRKRPGPGQPQLWLRCVVERRQSRGQLVDDVYGFRCPLLGLQLRLSRPNGQQNARWARFSVALPPGIGAAPAGRSCSTYQPFCSFNPSLYSALRPLEAVQNPGWSAQRHRRGRRCKTSQLVQPQAPASRLSPHTAVSKRRAADATPGGEPQRSLRSLALPLASAEKLLRRCPCSAQRSTQTARAALTPGRRAHRAFYWPAGRENPSLSARLGNHSR